MTALELLVDPDQPADASSFFRSGTALVSLLDELTDRPLTWIISDLFLGSAGALVTADVDTDDDRASADRAIADTVNGFRLILSGSRPPDSWQPDAVSSARALAHELLPAQGRIRGHLRLVRDDATRADAIELTNALSVQLDALAAVAQHSVGTLRGRLMGVNYSSGNRASLKPEVGRTVRVSFPDDLRESVERSLREPVMIQGALKRDTTGRTYFIAANRVEPLTVPNVRWVDLIGADPDFTGGMDTDTWLRVNRGED